MNKLFANKAIAKYQVSRTWTFSIWKCWVNCPITASTDYRCLLVSDTLGSVDISIIDIKRQALTYF